MPAVIPLICCLGFLSARCETIPPPSGEMVPAQCNLNVGDRYTKTNSLARGVGAEVVGNQSGQRRPTPTLARIWPTNTVGLSGICHVLLFYGLGPTDLRSIPSGETALRVLTDEYTAIKF